VIIIKAIELYLNANDAFIRYNAAQFLRLSPLKSYRDAMLADARVQKLIMELKNWPGPILSSHRSAQQFYHKLAFLADIGVQSDDEGVQEIIDRIMQYHDNQGIPQLPMSIPESYGGSGKETYAWALCDAPTILYALGKMGYTGDSMPNAVNFLAKKCRANGWGCEVSSELGSWHGPGKKSDACPYANLLMLKLLLLYSQKFKPEILSAAQELLRLWENSRTEHPYIFYMGNDFRKLKLPFIWYDIIHVVEVLSQIREIHADRRFQEMIKIIYNKETPSGDFISESVYKTWNEWDFGQKKQPSEWLGFIITRIRARLSDNHDINK